MSATNGGIGLAFGLLTKEVVLGCVFNDLVVLFLEVFSLQHLQVFVIPPRLRNQFL
jgi:hypothetical protein